MGRLPFTVCVCTLNLRCTALLSISRTCASRRSAAEKPSIPLARGNPTASAQAHKPQRLQRDRVIGFCGKCALYSFAQVDRSRQEETYLDSRRRQRGST